MKLMTTTIVDRPGSRRAPGLDVSIITLDTFTGTPSVFVHVRETDGSPRVHVYVDGTLIDSHGPVPDGHTFALGELAPGRHTVTARAIDADGRWGAASLVVAATVPVTSVSAAAAG